MERQKLPNATLIVILGALSLVTSCCYGVVGLVLSIVTLVLAGSAKKQYLADPELYDNYSQIKTGKILAIIGLVLSIIVILIVIAGISYIGWDVINNPELMQERMNEIQRQTSGV